MLVDDLRAGVLTGLVFALSACSNSKSGPLPKKDEPRDARPDSGELYLGLSTPSDGFQLRSIGAEIGPGDEREYCEVARLPGGPGDVYDVSSIELANGKNSHHLALAVVSPGSSAEAAVIALGVGNRQECPGPSIQFGEGAEVVATIQHPYGETKLPDGVAWQYTGGQYIVYDYHYANTGLDTLDARSAVNFHLMDSSDVQHIARTFFLNNLTLDTPPGKTASFTAECHFDADMMVGAFTRHTHHFGTDFSVWYAGGANDGQEIWTSHDWQNETDYTFTAPALVKAGEGFRYQCTYDNTTTSDLRFGTSIKDEMCMLYGPAWSAHDGDTPLEGCNITWIDDAGIGHPANEAGGFPKPSASDAATCQTFFGSAINDCNKCRCDSCATPLLKCGTDADCAPLLVCYANCADAACIENCSSLLHDHSSGEGTLTSVIACSVQECPICGAQTGTP
ncbi:MAG TPA: hypothetical protein VHU80_19055 [Polyangiaceae bacterium]|jgi:hypothetical protein|nr:hypothetical protein [Polyangiaceae bacterium]